MDLGLTLKTELTHESSDFSPPTHNQDKTVTTTEKFLLDAETQQTSY